MPLPSELDRLVLRAQRGDAAALEAVCARARPLLVRHARRLLRGSADVEDAVQEVLVVVCRRIGTYRWEGSFASWLYATATRTILRAGRSAADAAAAVELAESTLVSDHEPMTEGEWSLVEQDLHLACTLAVLVGLDAQARRLYLLGEVLCVPDRVGAEVAGTTPAAYRKRLERARRASPRRCAQRRPRPPACRWPTPPASSTRSCGSASCTARTRARRRPTARSGRCTAWRRRWRPRAGGPRGGTTARARARTAARCRAGP